MKRYFLTFFLIFICPWHVHASEISLAVQLSGVPQNLEEQLRSSVRIIEAAREPKLTRTRVYNLHYLAEEQIEEILQSLGYYSAKIESELQELPNRMEARYKITLGPPTLIRSVVYQLEGPGQNNAKFKKLPTDKLKAGHQLIHEVYESTKESILSKFVAEGYLDANFLTSEILVDIDEHHADIIMIVDTGPQYVFGSVIFLEDDYDAQVLSRYVPFYEGEAYSQKKLSSLRKNLFKSDLFDKVRVKTEKNPTTAANDVNILVKTQSKPKNHYFGKIGYNTDSLLNTELGWHRRIKPKAQHFKLFGSVSQVLQQAQATYLIPGRYAATDHYEFGTNLRREKFDEEYSRIFKLDATKVHQRHRLKTRFGLTFHEENYRQLTTDKEKTHFLIPNIRLTWVNELSEDRRGCGQKFEFAAKSAVKPALSSTHFLKLKFHGHINHCFSEDTILILKGTMGGIFADNFNKIPPSLRYLAGGDRSVRGFRYRSLGPKRINTSGKEINVGGKYLVLGSIELERRIWKDVGAAGFFDTGNAFDHWNDSLARAAGVGLRYHTPLGPFRLDFAKPLTDHGKKNIRFHLTFGWDL